MPRNVANVEFTKSSKQKEEEQTLSPAASPCSNIYVQLSGSCPTSAQNHFVLRSLPPGTVCHHSLWSHLMQPIGAELHLPAGCWLAGVRGKDHQSRLAWNDSERGPIEECLRHQRCWQWPAVLRTDQHTTVYLSSGWSTFPSVLRKACTHARHPFS